MRRFKAGALYYAIFISFFIALISGFMILQQWYHHYYAIYVQQGDRLERNMYSSMLVAMQNPELFPVDKKTRFDLFGDSLDLADVSKEWWGGYQLLRSDVKWRVIQKSRIELIGTETLPGDAIALYLADDGKYLSLAGKTTIQGNCYLPKLGVRKAYIEGTGFSGNRLIGGNIKDSKDSLPSVDLAFVDANRLNNQTIISEKDSTVDVAFLLKPSLLSNSFYNKTIKISTTSWLTLENKKMTGNIKLISTAGITLKKTASLKDVVLYAPKIEIEKGFEGSLQCFVTDTILVGEDCIFRYPSLVVINETKNENPVIDIGRNTVFLGDIVVIAKTDKENVRPECNIAKDVIINGSIYCAGKVNLQGTIKGQLFCKGFLLRTHSSIYENHLLNATINSSLLSPYYAGSMYTTAYKFQKTIKCLD